MLCHAANNTLATLLTAAGVDVFGWFANLVIVIAAVVLLGICLRYLQRHLMAAGPLVAPTATPPIACEPAEGGVAPLVSAPCPAADSPP
jgi:hypothetical protein